MEPQWHRDSVQVVGDREGFDSFLAREAPGVLAIALLVAPDAGTAAAAARSAMAWAARRWDRLQAEFDRVRSVRHKAFEAAWPRRSPSGGGDDDIARLRSVLWAMPKQSARALVGALVDAAVPGGYREVSHRSPTERLEPILEAWGEDLGADADRLLPEVLTGLRDTLRGADLEVVRPGAPRRRTMLVTVGLAGVLIGTLAVFRLGPLPEEEEGEPPARAAVTTRPTVVRPDRVVLDELPWWLEMEPQTTLVGMPGWETLAEAGTGWFASGVWTGSELAAWGGAGQPWRSWDDGALHLYDPATDEWRLAAPLPGSVCSERHGFSPALTVLDGAVLVRLMFGPPLDGCATAALYLPAEDRWVALPDPFFTESGRMPLVWTGEWLVDPAGAQAYHWESGETAGIPLPPGFDRGFPTFHAYWSGSAVVVAGLFGVASWAPGEEEWEVADDEALPSIGDRGGAWTPAGLLVVRAGAFEFFVDGTWSSTGSGASSRCWDTVVPAGLPVVRGCLGFAVWDVVRQTWVPYPYHTLDGHGWLIVTDDGDVYSLEHSLGRLRLQRDVDGSLVPPPTLPLGPAYLDVPEGFRFLASSQTSRASGTIEPGSAAERWSATFETADGVRCTAETVMGWRRPGGLVETGTVPVPRPGRVDRDAVVLIGDDVVALALRGPQEWRGFVDHLVTCFSADIESAEESARRLASGLWTPGESTYNFHAYFGDGGREIVVETEDGGVYRITSYATEPDRVRTEKASEVFRACVEGEMEVPGFVLDLMWMLVDADGGLMGLTYRGLRFEHWPPVAPVPDATRLACLDAAGVHLSYPEAGS